MPNRDGTGPEGLGPMFARGLGAGVNRGGYGIRRTNRIASGGFFSDRDDLIRRKECLERQLDAVNRQLK